MTQSQPVQSPGKGQNKRNKVCAMYLPPDMEEDKYWEEVDKDFKDKYFWRRFDKGKEK